MLTDYGQLKTQSNGHEVFELNEGFIAIKFNNKYTDLFNEFLDLKRRNMLVDSDFSYILYENDNNDQENLVFEEETYTALGVPVIVKSGDLGGVIKWSSNITENCNNDKETLPKVLWGAKFSQKSDYKALNDAANSSRATLINAFNRFRDALWEDRALFFTKRDINHIMDVLNDKILPLHITKAQMRTVQNSYPNKNFIVEKKFDAYAFATFLRNNNDIRMIENEIYAYNDGIYKNGHLYLEAETQDVSTALSSNQRKEVIREIELYYAKAGKSSEESPATLIAFKNGVYDIENDKLMPFSPDYIIRNKIPYNYNPQAYSSILDKTLMEWACNNEELKQLFEEAVGYTMFRRNELRTSFMLTGGKHNGKSTFLNLIAKMLGSYNVSSISLEDLGARFQTASMVGKLANIGDDINDGYISDLSVYKKLVSGDPMQVERKGQDPFTFKCYAKMFFSANSLPRLNDKTGAVASRLQVLPFRNSFSKEDPSYDPFIINKITTTESIEYLIQLGLRGLKRVITNNEFTKNELSQREWDDYNKQNNPILTFFEDYTTEDIEGQPTDWFYGEYVDYATLNNLKTMGRNEFTKQVKLNFKVDSIRKRVDGERKYILERITDAEDAKKDEELEKQILSIDEDIPF